MEETQK